MPIFDCRCTNCGFLEPDVLFRSNGERFDGIIDDVCPSCSHGIMVRQMAAPKSINMNPTQTSKEGTTADGTRWKAELTPKKYKPGRGLK